uniref:Uncharacterized protein n=1 Tax=uncultured prokaryote TaxID=198431 RepID=A0A0H5PZM5_9ZZZZ|nr:hypothetical protein [uncultured prokaryote]
MPIPEGYAQATWQFQGFGVPLGAVITAGLDIGGAPPTPLELAEGLFDAFAGSVINQLTPTVALTGVRVKFGPDATGPAADFNGNAPGLNSGEQTSPNVAFLVRKLTAQGGRSGRGRWYIPGVRETSVNSAGDLQSGSVTFMQDELDNFLIAVGALNTNLVILHQPGAPLTTPTPLTALQCDSRVATQRRRLRR